MWTQMLRNHQLSLLTRHLPQNSGASALEVPTQTPLSLALHVYFEAFTV